MCLGRGCWERRTNILFKVHWFGYSFDSNGYKVVYFTRTWNERALYPVLCNLLGYLGAVWFGFFFFLFFKLNLCIQQGIVCITAAAPEQPKQSATNEQIGSCQRVTHLGDCTAHWGCGILQCGKATKTHNHFWNGLITVYWSHLESNPRNLPTLLL